MGEVVWISRYPIKSMRGEALADADLDHSGVRGDRRFALVDQETGLLASAKNPRRWRGLLRISAAYAADGHVVVTLPDGTVVRGDAPEIDEVLSSALDRKVHLTSERPVAASLERLTPEGESPRDGSASPEVTVGRVGGGTDGDTFVDFAPVHIVTTGTLDALGRALPGNGTPTTAKLAEANPHGGLLAEANPRGGLDARRFRPNVVIRMFDEVPFEENTWTHRRISIGQAAVVRGIVPTPRCFVPTLAQGATPLDDDWLPDDPEVLRTAARQNRVPVLDLGVLTCVGAYAAVEEPGHIRVGDLVTVGA